jgi:hypothetical protein
MQSTVARGIGATPPNGRTPDIQAAYSAETALACTPDRLVARVNGMLMYGQMSGSLQTTITNAVAAIGIPSRRASQAQIDAALANRVYLAVFLTMASPEFMVQR